MTNILKKVVTSLLFLIIIDLRAYLYKYCLFKSIFLGFRGNEFKKSRYLFVT